jgi:hypothetical protein
VKNHMRHAQASGWGGGGVHRVSWGLGLPGTWCIRSDTGQMLHQGKPGATRVWGRRRWTRGLGVRV